MAIDATVAAAAAEVTEAEGALRDLVAEDPDRWQGAYELKARARNGWSAAAMSIALNRLLADGAFELSDGDQIRLSR